jgi:cell shape-determining protein MreD
MLTIVFLFCLLVHLFQGVLFPGFSLLSFAPFFAVCCMKTTLKSTLWLAAISGFCVDLLSDDPIGLHALNYTMISSIFYSLRWRFSFEEPVHLGLYTLFISCSSTLLQLVLLFLFDKKVPTGGTWILVDLICMPILDGIYALVFFSGPLLLWQQLRYRWLIYCLRTKKKKRFSL